MSSMQCCLPTTLCFTNLIFHDTSSGMSKRFYESDVVDIMQMSQPTPTSTGPQASPDPGLSTLDAQLSDLQCVLQEGGLSGEVRERGAEAVARARSALCTLAAEAVGLRAKLEEHDERRAMAIAALSGTTPTSAACSGMHFPPLCT